MGRIIAGSLSSRRIHTPAGDLTRPTTDRVRESIFALLASMMGTAQRSAEDQLTGVEFLDLYAGSGAVGLEAASRGAQPTWVEKARPAAKVIERNSSELSVRGRLFVKDVGAFLMGKARPYSVIWMDPPYDVPNEEIARIIALIDDRGWLAEDGILLVERAARSNGVEFPKNFLNNGIRRYGDTAVHIARKDRQ